MHSREQYEVDHLYFYSWVLGFRYQIVPMKTIVLKVLTRPATLNPQDSTVGKTLEQLGYKEYKSVRVGRYLTLEVADEVDATEMAKRIAVDIGKAQFAHFFSPVTDVFEVTVE